MAQSGGIFEATGFARACAVSRTTIANYVAVLESTFVVHLIRPFTGGGAAEIVSAPKVYGFDTGFVCYHRGWHEPTAIECKWSAAEFDPASLKAFRSRYLKGSNYVVSADVGSPLTRRYGALAVRFVSLAALLQELVRPGRPRRPR